MKSAEIVKREIANLRLEYGEIRNDKALARRIKTRIDFLVPLALWLEHNPAKEAVESQLTEIQQKLQRYEDAYPVFVRNNTEPLPPAKLKAKYREAMGIPLLRSQARALQYILED